MGSARRGIVTSLGLGMLTVAIGMAQPAPRPVPASQLPLLPSPRSGAVIERSGRIAPTQFVLPSPENGEAALTIRGDNLVIDFQGATLLGTPVTVEPDQRKGIGIRVEGKNVVLRNVKVRGYKVGILVENSPGFMLLDSDLSYNWKQRLQSTIEREDVADWMSFHRNEQREWLRYGAGIALYDSDQFKLRDVKIHGGQCGAMLTRSNRGLVINCDFSFLSAIGLGLYRSSDNVVMHNRIDWCVRGYSHGKWNRGQDSAGILVYEQSNRNIFAYNSVTHGGDGFFLWAGQSTMDTGEGGSNDNLLYGNDFSHAPTNGIEATFSRNRLVNNLIQECWHGIWAGYSYETQIVGNRFSSNGSAIAIEHGQSNKIHFNRFDRDVEAIALWSRPTQPADWPYAQKRDVTHRDVEIRGNTFENISKQVFDLRGVQSVNIWLNTLRNNARTFNPDLDATSLIFAQNTVRAVQDPSRSDWERVAAPEIGVRRNSVVLSPAFKVPAPWMEASGRVLQDPYVSTRAYLGRFDENWNPMRGRIDPAVRRFWVAPQRGGRNPFLTPGTLRGRRYILVDEWGPYDFKSPKLWPRSERISGNTRIVRFEVLGPFGRWRVRQNKGAVLSSAGGSVPGFVEARIPLNATSVEIGLEYVGRATVDHRGVVTPAGERVAFGYRDFRVPMSWRAQFWSFDPQTQDPREHPEAFEALMNAEPLREVQQAELAFQSQGAFFAGGPADFFATKASSAFTVSPGRYRLRFHADDGIRARVDGRLIVDEWKYSPPATYTVDLDLGGSHQIQIEHFELQGYAQLKFEIERLGPSGSAR